MVDNVRQILEAKFTGLEKYIAEHRKEHPVHGIVLSVDATKHTASGQLRLGNSIFDVDDEVLNYITEKLHSIAERFELKVMQSVFTERGEIGDYKQMRRMRRFRNWIFIFNDNVLQLGNGGTAAIRDKTDTLRYGIPTGWEPGARHMGFVSLDDTANRIVELQRRAEPQRPKKRRNSTSAAVPPQRVCAENNKSDHFHF